MVRYPTFDLSVIFLSAKYTKRYALRQHLIYIMIKINAKIFVLSRITSYLCIVILKDE